MTNNLIISDINVSLVNGNKELSALVDGERVFFSVPECHDISPVVEPFVGIALLEAMISDRPIEIKDTAISKKLFDRLTEIQEIYSCWNNDLKIVEIIANTSSDIKSFTKVGSFFSAGIDSTHTLIRNMEKITHLIIFRTFEARNDIDSWKILIQKQAAFANSINKRLIPVETNARKWIDDRKISWPFAHGLFLSSAGGAFGLKKIYVPSSHTYDELFPWGSHPLSDPMWSTESTTVIHDGAGFRRGEKMREILKNKVFADNLQTCWEYAHKNCGTCPKCARSVLSAYLLGKETKSLPLYKGENTLKSLKAIDESGATFLEDAMLLAKNTKNQKIYQKLKRYYRLYQFDNILFSIDRYLLGNAMRDIYRKIKKPKWLDARVNLRGKNKWEI